MSAFAILLEKTKQQEKLRVWSLIITLFGDVVVPRGGVISATTVGLIMAKLGIEAGAVRTALSRLASDGWIIREKIGRNAFYRLSTNGDELFEKASSRIYAPLTSHEQRNSNWMIAIADRSGNGDMTWAEQFEGLCFTSNIALFNEPSQELRQVAEDEECLLLEGDLMSLPPWIRQKIEPDSSREAYLELIQLFSEFEPNTDLEAIAGRTLLIHQWRRQLLRTPDLPAALFSSDWPGFQARKRVAELYKQLFAQSENWLDDQMEKQALNLPKRFE